MYLNFIGSGSALNTELGNNCAFIKEEKSILLIDCGSTTFSRIQSLKLLESVREIFVLITHRHPDHIASLGDLIFYANYIIDAHVTVLTPDEENVCTLLRYMGVQKELYTLVKLDKEFKLKNPDFEILISYVPVQHVEEMPCYGYMIKYKNTYIYYSGDAKDIPKEILQRFVKKELDYIYQDVCSYDHIDNPHMYIERLHELIEEKDRNRLFCMHYDEGLNKTQIQQIGFHSIKNFGE
ncbi:MAG TPA: MBL fold metallo-hydrolase [Patescibacteria group bacterium]|nr:MBL fold metallo-hydrolase [Patescibacteria group bacterium]